MDETDPADLQDSTPGSAGRHRAEGSMGVSSERTGPTGPGQDTTDGVRDTSVTDDQSPEDPEQRPADPRRTRKASNRRPGIRRSIP